MNEFDKKIWLHMLEIIEKYKTNAYNYSSLVNGLEGILNASDIHDNSIIKKWYQLWQPLEIQNAISGNNTKKRDIIVELDILETYIREQL